MNRRQFTKAVLEAAVVAGLDPLAALSASGEALPRFSCMLWTLQKLAAFDRSLEIVAEAGFQGVELVGEFQKWGPDEARRMLKRLQSLGLVIDSMSGVKTGFAVPEKRADFLQEFQEHLHYAETLGCKQVILLSGPVVSGLSPDAQQQAAVTSLTQAADLAAKASIEIVIEPIDPLEQPTIYLQSVSQAFPIARAVNRPNLKVLYDLYHEQRAFGNLLEKLESNLDLIGLIHVADVPGRHEPGTGEIDYPVIYRKLAALHYSRWIAMEFYPTQDPVSTLRAARLAAISAFRA